MDWFVARVHAWADFASVGGVVISLIGFGGTIYGLFRARSAAKQVAVAVSNLRDNLAAKSAAEELSRVMHDIEELRHLHRVAAWEILPPRYAFIRRSVLAVKQKHPSMTRGQKSTLQGITEQFSTIEEIVEKALGEKRPPEDVPGLNRLISQQGDKLSAMLTVIQDKIGAKQ